MVEGEISRKVIHPTVVPPRARMKELVDTFREISGNGIIVSEEGQTLCAVVSGDFGLPAAACEALMKSLRSWQQDPTARIPPPTKTTPLKRSYDKRNHVSGEACIFKAAVFLILNLLYTFRMQLSTMGGQFQPGATQGWGNELFPKDFWRWRGW